MRSILPTLALPALLAFAPVVAADLPASPEGLELFESKIRPVLIEKCYSCHSAGARRLRGGLRLDSGPSLRAGGDRGAVLDLERPEASLLLRAIRYEDPDLQMPPRGKLPEELIEPFERWIALGAPDPREGSSAEGGSAPHRQSGADREPGWAFFPPTRHMPPRVENESWARGDIDRFVLARIEAAGLTAGADAAPATLVRRLSHALRGLPPGPEDVRSFVEEPTDESYARLVDRYLATAAFAERFTQVWLDVARYAFDQAHIVGNNESLFFPNAWMYRDWVIEALGADLPFDRFVRLQLAADLVEGVDSPNLAALGFIGLGPKYYNRNDPRVRADEWEDRVDVVGRGLLGITVACARCHDHKFDPISTEDYYALAGVFASTELQNRSLGGEAGKGSKEPGSSLHVVKEGKPQDLRVQVRGDPEALGDTVPRGFLAALSPGGVRREFHGGSGRAELADAIVDPANPLASRVFVHRVWAFLVGVPIVDTPSNFGRLGGQPSHPWLLDDLSVRFRENGGSLKWLVREIVLSSTFRQTSLASEESRRVDPANRLLSHATRRRLSAEAWRDGLLAASGELDATIGGPPIEASDESATRRTVYSRISRFQLDAYLALFDHPDPNSHAAKRSVTTTPLQKLYVLHSPFVVARARALARRVESLDPVDAIDHLHRHVFQRAPLAAESSLAREFLDVPPSARKERLELYAHALLASNEALFVD